MFTGNTKLLGPVIVALFVIVGICLTIAMGLSAWALMSLAMLLCILVGNPPRLLAFYWMWLVVGSLVVSLYGAPLITMLDKILSILMLSVILIHQIYHRRKIPEFKYIWRSLLALIFLGLVSMTANRVPAVVSLHFVFSYFRCFIIFYFILFFVKNPSFKGVLLAVVITLLLQVILNVGWLFGVNPLQNRGMDSGDFAIGSVGGCNQVAYFCIPVALMMMSLFKSRSGTAVKIMALLLAAVVLFQLWITYTIHAEILMVVCFLIYVVQKIRLDRRALAALLVIVFSIAILIPVHRKILALSGDDVSLQLSPEYVVMRWNQMWNGVKGQAYQDVLFRVPKDLPYPILGAGPGNFASSIGQHYKRPLAEQYINYVANANTREYLKLSVGGSVTGLPSSGFLSIWSELGPIGWLLYWGCPFYAMLRVLRFLRRSSYTDKYQLILAEAFVPTMFLWLGLSLLADFAFVPFLHDGLWALAAFVWKPYEPVPPMQMGSADLT